MTFAEKLKTSRKAINISQEQLAEKLGVSRQAVTKWETGRGMPDVENIKEIATLFGMTIDDFISGENESISQKEFLNESKTEYDIDDMKRFELNLGGAQHLNIIGTDGEKIIVKLQSSEISTLRSDFKTKIDDIKKRIDVVINRVNDMTEAKSKANLYIDVFLPNKYLTHVDIHCNCNNIILSRLVCDELEFKGKADKITFDSLTCNVSLDCNTDLNICLKSLQGLIEINQISSTSKIAVPKNYKFKSLVRGLSNRISFEENGKPIEDFSTEESENIIELNGVKSELVILRQEVVSE